MQVISAVDDRIGELLELNARNRRRKSSLIEAFGRTRSDSPAAEKVPHVSFQLQVEGGTGSASQSRQSSGESDSGGCNQLPPTHPNTPKSSMTQISRQASSISDLSSNSVRDLFNTEGIDDTFKSLTGMRHAERDAKDAKRDRYTSPFMNRFTNPSTCSRCDAH
jgi:hypothetical protein